MHLAPDVCPYHTFVEYRQRLKDHFKAPADAHKYQGPTGTEAHPHVATAADAPVFPDMRGEVVHKAAGASRRSSRRPASHAATSQAAGALEATLAASLAAGSGRPTGWSS